ncbi:MAG: hypothetical protein CMF48_01470 [Legionellales bacterium]|nr:hypothetical protein [Legionellales bacterium]
MLVKILIGILIAIIAFRIIGWCLAWYLRYRLRKFMTQQQRRMQDAFSKPSNANFQSGQKNQERMVRCGHCGVFIPTTQAYVHKGLSFCGAAHSKAFSEKNN